jgi:hypothetical protein
VWSNGVLASLAVGLVVQMVTPWTRRARPGAYLSYDGNSGLVTEAERFRRWTAASCSHYPHIAVGDPSFDIRKFLVGDVNTAHAPLRWMEFGQSGASQAFRISSKIVGAARRYVIGQSGHSERRIDFQHRNFRHWSR